MLKIYSTEGVLLRTIKFSKESGIEYLWHAVELRQGDFIVSHGCIFPEARLHRVCIVSQDGKKIKKSFGKERGPSAEETQDIGQYMKKLNEPSYLAVTAEGSILVTDMKNHRVLLLTKDLEYMNVFFATENHLPETMYFDKKNGQLFVGSNLKIDGDGRVLRLPCTIE